MKITKRQLKRIIKEELKNLQERTMAPSGEFSGKPLHRGKEERIGRFQGMLYALEDNFFPFLDGADPDGLRMAEELYRHLQEMIKEYGGSEKTLHERRQTSEINKSTN